MTPESHATKITCRLSLRGELASVCDGVRRYGYQPDAMIGRNLFEFVHPDDRADIRERLTRRQNGDDIAGTVTLRMLDADGNVHHFRAHTWMAFEESNGHRRPVGVESELWEVDEEGKRSRAALALFDADVLPMAVCHDDRIEQTNRSFVQLSGLPAERLIGRSMSSLLRDGRDPESLQRLLQEPAVFGDADSAEAFFGGDLADPVLVRITRTRLAPVGHGDVLWSFQPRIDLDSIRTTTRQVESRYQELVERADEAIFLYEDGFLLECNQRALEMFGRERDEIRGCPPWDPRLSEPIQPNGQEAEQAGRHRIDLALSGEPQVFRWLHRRKSGEPFFAEASLKRLHGDRNRLLCVVRDLTDRIEEERRLRESEERFRRIFEDVDIGIVLVDETGAFLKVNPCFQSIVGFPEENLLQMQFPMLHFPEDSREDENRLHDELIAGTRDKYKIRKRLRHVDGSERIVNATTGRLETDTDHPIFISLIEDITGQVRGKEERDLLQRQLVQAQKMEEIGRVTGGIAHDFNNLLTVLQGHMDIAEVALDKTTPPREILTEHIREMKLTVTRASNLTRQLLAFSRTQAADPIHVDINVLLKDLQKMLQRVLPAPVRMDVQGAPDAGTVHADPTQLTQIMLNLSTNAADAMPDGGELTVSIRRRKVAANEQLPSRLGDVPRGDYVELEVADTGVGIPSDVLAHIFDPFFTTKEAGRGTGLGLSTTIELIKTAGGFIDVQSRPGVGTVFTIWLPRSGGVDQGERETDRAVTGGNESIFVVEDEEIIRRIVDRMLRINGYTTRVFSSAEDALDHCVTHQDWPDLLLTDIVLPNRSGTELITAMQEHMPELKVVCMSGYTRDSESLTKVMDDKLPFLPKPFKRHQLLDLVREVLDT